MITSNIEIDRPPAEVFAYLAELDRHSEWQHGLVSSSIESAGPVGVGTRGTHTRKVPGGTREMSYEITEHDPPRRTSWRVLEGPVRAVGTMQVEPLADGARARVSVEFDLEGHGLGALVAPLARRQARKQLPADHAKLKEILERHAKLKEILERPGPGAAG